ncbi:MAG: flagellar assembly protein FliH, partial [Pseudomonadota bacterium]|nr:flagellar assembly protein FliH [Pseudomonadota bacterium]
MAPAQLRPFGFETVFDGDGGVVFAPAVRKRAFSSDDVETARREGFAEGERSAVVKAEQAQAAALREIAQAAAAALASLAEVAHAHKEGCAALSLACARVIADAALDAFPEAPAEAALRTLTAELDSAPRMFVRTSSADPARVEAALTAVADEAGLAGRIAVRPEPNLPRAGFVFDWGDGKA